MFNRLFNLTSLKANIIANYFGNGWVALIGLIFIPIYLKYIGPEAYGLIGIFGSIQMVLAILDAGLSTSINRELASLMVLPNTQQKMRNMVRTLGTVYWGVAVGAGLIALALSPFLAHYWVKPERLDEQTIMYAFALLSMSVVFQLPAGFYSGALMGLQKQVLLNFLRIAFATIRNVGALMVLLFVSNSVLAFFVWTFIVSILQAFVMRHAVWIYLPKGPDQTIFDKDELKRIWRFATGMTGISITAILLTQTDKIILSNMLSLEQFGYYTIASTLGLMIYQIMTPLTQSYFPSLTSLVSLNDSEKLKYVYHQACQMITVLVIPAVAVLAFFSRELIFIWTNNPITVKNTWEVTTLYAIGTGLNALLNIPYLLVIAHGWTKLTIYQNVALLCLMIPLTIYLASHYGAIGGALTWIIINFIYFMVTPILIHKKFLKGETVKWYWNDTIKPLLFSILIITAAYYFVKLPLASRMVSLLLIICFGIFSIIAGVLFATNVRRPVFVLLRKLKLKYF